jgi:hypothetical protein
VAYNMGQGLMAGPSQGMGAAFGKAVEGTPWAAGPSDVVTGAIAGGTFSAVTGAGQALQTINGVHSLASTALTAGEAASIVGIAKFGVDFLTYAGGVAACSSGSVHH